GWRGGSAGRGARNERRSARLNASDTVSDLGHERAVRPRLRGVLHQAAFIASIVVAPLLLVSADGFRARVAAAVFACSVTACFGASALYHRVTWTPSARRWMRRVDHAGVYLLIAGTYTPVALLVLAGDWERVILVLICAGA